jgi:hypothetical protein
VGFELMTFFQGLKHTKKKLRFYSLFILERPTTKSIQFINKPVFLFWFFHVVVLVLPAKQQQQKSSIYIFDICLGLAFFISDHLK